MATMHERTYNARNRAYLAMREQRTNESVREYLRVSAIYKARYRK